MVERADLRAGAFMAPYHAPDEDTTIAFERDFELIEWLDRLGLNEAWIGEHHSGGYELIGSPELFIAAAAERTRRIMLGTGVISLPYHNPLMVAGRMVQLDHQTRGRAMFGMGPGLLASDASMLGIDSTTQRGRMAQAIDVIVRLLAGETVTETTDWYRLVDARLQLSPYTRPRPQLAVASAITPSGGKIAGRYGLGMLCVAAASGAGYDVLDLNWGIASEIAAARGAAMDRSALRIVLPMHIAETREQALANLRWGWEKWAHYSFQVTPAGPAALGLAPPEEMIALGTAALGTPDDAVAVLEKYWAKTGGFGCLLNLEANWADTAATRRSYELLARYVLPKFAGRLASRQASLQWLGDNRDRFSGAIAGAAQQAIDAHFAEKAQR